MRDAIKRAIDLYASDGIPTGGFLRAVLEHRDVWDVMGRADEENAQDIMEILRYIHSELPGNCHGSRDVVRAWIDAHRPVNVSDSQGVTPDERTSLSEGVEG